MSTNHQAPEGDGLRLRELADFVERDQPPYGRAALVAQRLRDAADTNERLASIIADLRSGIREYVRCDVCHEPTGPMAVCLVCAEHRQEQESPLQRAIRQRDEAEAKVTACAKLIRHLRHRAATGELSHGRLWCDGVRFSANQLETIIGTDENDG